MARILIADGGTGGHIFMAIAVADELRKRKEVESIVFTGTPLGLEGDLVPRHNYELHMIQVGGLIGKNLLTRVKTLLQLPFAYLGSRKIIRQIRPSVAIGFGAYASGPVLLAAHHKKVPILLVEPNAVPGFTNRIILKYAKNVAVAYEDHNHTFAGKAVVTGTPVRPLQKQTVAAEKFVVGIFGGSQGARAINETVSNALPALVQLQDKIHIIHQTGKRDFEELKKRYDQLKASFEVTAFIHDVEKFYARCDLLICRAGAITLAEITTLGKPAVLVPLPTATHNHQEQNARRLAEAGAARMILQRDFTSERFVEELQSLLRNREELEKMGRAAGSLGKPDAGKNVADLALSLINGAHL